MADSVRGRVMWYELLTSDMKAAEKFYTNVVGWTVQPFDGSPQPYDMWMRDGGQPVGGVMTIPEGMNFPPHWEMYVGVDNLEDAVAQIQASRRQRAWGRSSRSRTVGRMQTMTDPAGRGLRHLRAGIAPERARDGAAEWIGGSWHELMTTTQRRR